MAEMPVQQPGRVVLPPHRQRARRPLLVRAREWLLVNLFPSPWGSLLTVVTLAAFGALIAFLVWFIFDYADWSVVTVNRKLLFAGVFPIEEQWRLWTSVIVVFSLIGLAYGTWSSLGVRDNLFIILAGAFAIFLAAHGGAGIGSTIWLLIAFAALYASYFATIRCSREPSRMRTLQQRAVGGLFVVSFPAVLIILMAFGGASAQQFDGFVLNLVLAPAGIVGGLIIAIPLALGRASNLRALKWTCTAYIEIVRGAPLLGWLFVALFILDDVIGGDLILRTMVVLAVFTGAYMAEYIRGALQTLPKGQYEASHAVGLPYWRTMQIIVLPQALRISIPPIVGQAISIWKDTTLVTVILPLRELKGNADSAINQPAFIDDRIEAYVFVAVVFWIVAFVMSRVSQRMEHALGVGER